MEGLGNDFVVLDGPRPVSPDEVARWCDRRRGIGADGVLVVTPQDGERVRMEYWNADGSAAEMCGNGLRCVARYAFDRGWTAGRSFTVETALGDRPVEVAPEVVRAFLGGVEVGDRPVRVGETEATFASVGNPHAVVSVEDPRSVRVDELGRRIGEDGAFPEGANVEFVAVRGRDLLELRVWERGVGETESCGTGACAAAVAARAWGLAGDRLTVHQPGGALRVELDGEQIVLTGPAVHVCAVEVAVP